MTEEHFQGFIAAWFRRDVDAVMTFMSQDCIYTTSMGPEPGRTYTGYQAVRHIFADILAEDDGTELHLGQLFLSGTIGYQEWWYTETRSNGERIPHRGIDVYQFEGDKIKTKNVFRKVLT